MKSYILIVILATTYFSFGQFKTPEWCKKATIYEVNIRQFTPEGTFAAFSKHLPRLKQMGVDIIWLMPIHPIGEKNRKGGLGSYYAVRNYEEVNAEFGTMADFQQLVKETHANGMKLIIDWVANHTSPDNVWVGQGHMDWYTLDSTGNLQPTIGTDWWDVADLNYDNKEMRKAMISSMQFWLKNADIDGFRCDVAGWVPMDFWIEARKELDAVKPIFFLAESEGADQHQAFDMTYGWELHHVMNEIAKGKKSNADVLVYFEKNKYKRSDYRMHFTSNHDENSWNGTEMERMGDARFALAVFAATIEGMPLVYNGQETSLDKRLRFFEKDTIDWLKMDLVSFYTKLLQLNRKNSALWNGEYGALPVFHTDANSPILIYSREKDRNKVVVAINMSAKDATLKLTDTKLFGKYKELFSGEKLRIKKDMTLDLEAWGYRVWVK
jgi:alpha-amylase